MRNLKKFLALVLAMMMVFSMMVTVNAASLDGYTDSSNVDSKYAFAVDLLSQIGIFRGTDGKFNPKDTLSRAEASTLIYRLISGDVKDAQVSIYKDYFYGGFDDVPSTNWAAGYINFAANGRYVVGDGTGNFNPENKLDGYQLLAILLRAIGYGKNGEYQGSGWEIRTATDSNRLGITKNITEGTLGQPITREVVAQIIYNTLQVKTAAWNGLTYPEEDKTLITLTSSKAQDDWGVPSTNYAAHWNKVSVADQTASFPEKALKTYTAAETECEVAAALGEKADFKISTFTNGKANSGSQTINVLDTNGTIGAQGRETAIYTNPGITGVDGKYIVVYKDTFIGEITGVTHAITDKNSHEIIPASTSIYLRYYAGTVTVAGDTLGVRGQYVTMHLIRGATLATSTPKDVAIATPVTKTVDEVTKGSNRWSNEYLSFKATDGSSYKYNCTFNDSYLNTESIGRTYDVYLDGNNNILYAKEVLTGAYGVVDNFKLVDEGKGVWSIDFTILTGANTTTTVRVYNPNDAKHTDRTGAEQYAEQMLDELVTVSADGNNKGYCTLGPAFNGANGWVSGGITNTIGTYAMNALVYDGTVFFVARYDGKKIYTKEHIIGYDIVEGFKGIDLLKTGQIASYIPSVDYDGYADYVLVRGVYDVDGLNETNSPVPNYAYVVTDDDFVTIDGNGVYTYVAYVNGTKTTLKSTVDLSYNSVAADAGRVAYGSGLYTYKMNNRGEASFDPVAAVSPVINGVRTLTRYNNVAGCAYLGAGAQNHNYVPGVLANTETIADNVAIYMVVAKTGEIVTIGGYDYMESIVNYVNSAKTNAVVYGQRNVYGWVDLIYVVDYTEITDVTPGTGTDDPEYEIDLAIGNTVMKNWIDDTTNLRKADFYVNDDPYEPDHDVAAGIYLIEGLVEDDYVEIDHGINILPNAAYDIYISLREKSGSNVTLTPLGRLANPSITDKDGRLVIEVNDIIDLLADNDYDADEDAYTVEITAISKITMIKFVDGNNVVRGITYKRNNTAETFTVPTGYQVRSTTPVTSDPAGTWTGDSSATSNSGDYWVNAGRQSIKLHPGSGFLYFNTIYVAVVDANMRQFTVVTVDENGEVDAIVSEFEVAHGTSGNPAYTEDMPEDYEAYKVVGIYQWNDTENDVPEIEEGEDFSDDGWTDLVGWLATYPNRIRIIDDVLTIGNFTINRDFVIVVAPKDEYRIRVVDSQGVSVYSQLHLEGTGTLANPIKITEMSDKDGKVLAASVTSFTFNGTKYTATGAGAGETAWTGLFGNPGTNEMISLRPDGTIWFQLDTRGLIFDLTIEITTNKVATEKDYEEKAGEDLRGYDAAYEMLGIHLQTSTTENVITYKVSKADFFDLANLTTPVNGHTLGNWTIDSQQVRGNILAPGYNWAPSGNNGSNNQFNATNIPKNTAGNIIGAIGVNFLVKGADLSTIDVTKTKTAAPGDAGVGTTSTSAETILKNANTVTNPSGDYGTVGVFFTIAEKVATTGRWQIALANGTHTWTVSYINDGLVYTWTVNVIVTD